MLTDKAISLCLYEILREYSDENHILSMSQLKDKLNSLYELNPDRRTIYDAMENLRQVGYDISSYEENHKGYYMRDKILEPTEAKLLYDAVCAFPFISEAQTRQLNEKIQKLLTVHERKQISHLSIERSEIKTENRNLFYNLQVLNESIDQRVKVKFTYLTYDKNLKLVPKREKKYTVNPFGMVYTNEHYYLVCSVAYQHTISMYRIDRMRDIALTTYELDNFIDVETAEKAVKNAVYAHVSEPENIVFLCDREVLNDVVDKFGTEIHVDEYDEKRYRIRLRASRAGMQYWALQYLSHVEIQKPVALRRDILEVLGHNPYTAGEEVPENGPDAESSVV